MRRRSLALAILIANGIVPSVHGLTLDEIKARLKTAGYSQIREMPSGKIKTFRAVREGRERSIVVDSNGNINELP